MKHPIRKFYAFLDQPIRLVARCVLAIAPLLLVASYFCPLWKISMEAPQYPNGLYLDIYAYKLEGGNNGQHLAEINNLNHYIGMHPIDHHALSDLDWMPFAIGMLILVTWRVAAIGNVRSLIDLSVFTVYVLGFMGARFIYRLYEFGHHLDPDAPFTVEPFMPAVFGTKQIANFTTHSFPELGSYFVTGFALSVAAVTIWQLIVGRRAAAALEARRRADGLPSTPPDDALTA